jgi:hypothetical protein
MAKIFIDLSLPIESGLPSDPEMMIQGGLLPGQHQVRLGWMDAPGGHFRNLKKISNPLM